MPKVCRVCGSEYEYIKLLDCYGCPKCTKDKVLKTFFIQKMLEEKNEEVEWDKKN